MTETAGLNGAVEIALDSIVKRTIKNRARRLIPEIRKLECQLYVHVGANSARFYKFLRIILEQHNTEVQIFDQPERKKKISFLTLLDLHRRKVFTIAREGS